MELFKRLRAQWPLLLVLVLAALPRIYNLGHGVGVHPDERHMIMVAQRLGLDDLNPHSFAYGSFPYYLLWITSETLALFEPTLANYDGLFMVGRGLCVAFGLLGIYLVARLARIISPEPAVPILAAALLAFNAFHLQLSRFYTVDIVLTTLCTAALIAMIRIAQGSGWRQHLWCGVLMGLAVASKITALFLLAPLGTAFLVSRFRARAWIAGVPLARMTTLLVVAALTFCCVEPYAILDSQAFLKDSDEQTRMVRGLWRPPYTIQFEDTLPYFYHLKQFLYTMGWPLAVTTIVSFIVLVAQFFKKPRGEMLVLFAYFVPAFVLIAGFQVKFPRYLMPMYPVLMTFAALFLADVARRFSSEHRVRSEETAESSTSLTTITSHSGHPEAAIALSPLLLGMGAFSLLLLGGLVSAQWWMFFFGGFALLSLVIYRLASTPLPQRVESIFDLIPVCNIRPALPRVLIYTLTLLLLVLGYRGHHSTIEITAQGPRLIATFNGSVIAEVSNADPRPGAIAIELPDASESPLLWRPSIRTATVTTREGSTDLLADRSCESLHPGWTRCEFGGPYTDFTLTVQCRSCKESRIQVRTLGQEHGYSFWSRPWLHHDFTWAALKRGQLTDIDSIRHQMSFSFLASLSGIAAELFVPLLIALTVAIALEIFAALLPAYRRSAYLSDLTFGLPATHSARHYAIVGVICGLSFLTLLTISISYYGGIPHSFDEIAAWFTAKTLAAGSLVAPAPFSPEHFTFPFTFIDSERWYASSTLPWPFLLAIGEMMQMPWVLPAIIGALTVLAVIHLGEEISSRRVGLLAGVLLMTSLWFQMVGGSFSAVGLVSLLVTTSLLFWCRWRRGQTTKDAALTGASVGLLFATMPIIGVVVALPLMVASIAHILEQSYRSRVVAQCGIAVAVGLELTLIYLLFNAARTGSILLSPPLGDTGVATSLFQLEPLSLSQIFARVWSQLSILRHIALTLPASLSLVGVAIAVLLMKKRRVLLMVTILTLIALVSPLSPNVLSSVNLGPRLCYPMLPLIAVLSALGFALLSRTLFRLTADVTTSRAIVLTLVAVLITVRSVSWYLVPPRPPAIDPATPLTIAGIRNFNDISPALAAQIRDIQKPSVIFIAEKSWQAFAEGFVMVEPFIDQSTVWIVRDLGPEKNREVLSRAGDRKIYRVNTNSASLSEY